MFGHLVDAVRRAVDARAIQPDDPVLAATGLWTAMHGMTSLLISILSVVYDAARDGSDLYVLDATDFAGPPVAKVRLPQRVPYGLHGSWVPDTALT